MNPEQPGKKRRLSVPGIKDPFIAKLALIISGIVVVLIIVGMLISFAFKGNNVDTAGLVSLAQTQQELVRLARQGTNRSSQPAIRNLSITVQLSVDTNKLQLLDYLKENGHKINTKDLNLKRNITTDTRLAAAIQTSTFDSVYVQIMQDSLIAYNTEIENATNRAVGPIEKQILAKTADAATLLLKQVPSIESVQPGT